MNCPNLTEIDCYGEMLVGCLACNRWASRVTRSSLWNC
jgi:hypothetical protein